MGTKGEPIRPAQQHLEESGQFGKIVRDVP
jgi:hypothetical protein